MEETQPVQQTSPVVEEIPMDFFDAVRALSCGEYITRQSWNDASLYFGLHNAIFMIHRTNGTWEPVALAEADLQAEDWKIITDR